MRRNQSGAAQVSMMWVIFLIVLVLSLSGFTYIAWRDKADKENERLTAIRERDKANTKAEEDRGKVINISEVVGFRDEAVVGSTSDIEAIKEKIDFMMGRFPDHVGSTVNNVEKVIDSIVDACNRMKRELDEKNATLETEIRTRREAQGNLQNIEQQKNMRIQELEGMVNDEQQRAATQKEEDNQRVANLQNQLDELSSRIREVEAQAESDKVIAQKEISTLQARISALGKKLEVFKEPDLPDGTVICPLGSASDEDMLAYIKSGLVYIDIGGRNGLRRGTKFDVFRKGKGGELILKGRIEVRAVDKDTATCGIVSQIDNMDPILPGDVVVNPLYAKNMDRTFVLLGRFPASMNKGFITDRLVALGYTVDKTISPSTDFLVLGDKEEGEFAQNLTDTDEYKLADKLGVQIVRIDDILDFIRF